MKSAHVAIYDWKTTTVVRGALLDGALPLESVVGSCKRLPRVIKSRLSVACAYCEEEVSKIGTELVPIKSKLLDYLIRNDPAMASGPCVRRTPESKEMYGSKILVVEDHPMSRKMLIAMLRQTYTVVPAASGPEALSLAGVEKPDLVLLDVEMPDMDGFQTLGELRHGVIDEAVPVIFLTARTDSESRDKGLEAGAVDYITKPYDRHELSIKVKNHLALYEARKEIERRNSIMAQEMEMASQLQRSLLPQDFPRNDRVTFSVAYVPTLQASGDFYDVIELPDGRIGFAQVDVSGHGVHSAMIGAMFKMAFQTHTGRDFSPSRLLSTINGEMFRVLPDSDFLTVFFGVIDANSLDFVYSNGGHPRPFLYKAADHTILELAEGGPLIGAFPGMDYDEGSLSLASGDRILIFTDGVTEAGRTGNANEFYGEERLRSAFLRYSHLQPNETMDGILNDVKEFRADESFDDDVSMLLVAIH